MEGTKHHTVSLPDIELQYVRAGRGAPLLLLHGFTGCSSDWQHAAGDTLAAAYTLLMPDARGHGGSSNPLGTITHRQCARDMLAFLDALGVQQCRAIGVSMGGNVLLHMARLAPARISAMVLVSATMYFPEQAREIMRQLPMEPAPEQWASLRARHPQGDAQIRALWRAQRALADDVDDMSFTPAQLSEIRARALVVYGDRDPLYSIQMGVDMFRALPHGQLYVVPNGGHAPVFLEAAEPFVRASLAFLRE
jgi:pimeloyl-ACP methyl ester carboxylesterase